MSDKLERCPNPKCNGAIPRSSYVIGYGGLWELKCDNCGRTVATNDAKETVGIWNRRATPTAETGWQGMESAPMDGTPILFWDSAIDEYGIATYRTCNGKGGKLIGCWDDANEDICFPSHWRPLPPPPQEVE